MNLRRLRVVVQDRAHESGTPTSGSIRAWVAAAISDETATGEITVRIVTEQESADLNRHYRGRGHATNVLAFPAGDDWPVAENELPYIGDIVICAGIVAREAGEGDGLLDMHWAHIVVHGALHLLGYDHEDETDANIMEQREREILSHFGFPDPYAVHD